MMRKLALGLCFGLVLFAGSGCKKEKGALGVAGQDLTLAFPQALGSALWANPDVYDYVPLKIITTGEPANVEVDLAGVTVEAQDDDGDGEWIASLPVKAVGEGNFELTARALRWDGSSEIHATLGIGTQGVQLTDYYEVKVSATPKLHKVGDRLFVTWTDHLETTAKAWLQEVNGAGQWIGERIVLVGEDEEALNARTAFGESSIGILFQKDGEPYRNFFKIVNFEGKEILPAENLDPEISLDGLGYRGAHGGDIAFDGSGFVFVWRVRKPNAKGIVFWSRVDEETHEAIRSEVTMEGDEDPHGEFNLYTLIKVAVQGETSVVSFVRDYYNQSLDMTLEKSQIVKVSKDGTVFPSVTTAPSQMWNYHHEARIFPQEEGFLSIWSESDLLDPSDTNPSMMFRGVRLDANGVLDPVAGNGVVMLQAPDTRNEPFLLPHSEHLGVLMWTDNRDKTSDPGSGIIQLFTAGVGDDLLTFDEKRFAHARFIEGTSKVSAVESGGNALMFWLDERHGGTMLNSKPELWFDTIWF